MRLAVMPVRRSTATCTPVCRRVVDGAHALDESQVRMLSTKVALFEKRNALLRVDCGVLDICCLAVQIEHVREFDLG
jgi:hypothetical protein